MTTLNRIVEDVLGQDEVAECRLQPGKNFTLARASVSRNYGRAGGFEFVHGERGVSLARASTV
jgi:hypothetical protein